MVVYQELVHGGVGASEVSKGLDRELILCVFGGESRFYLDDIGAFYYLVQNRSTHLRFAHDFSDLGGCKLVKISTIGFNGLGRHVCVFLTVVVNQTFR